MTTQKMLSFLRKGIEKYKLIQNGDKIAVGVSGGKDSVTLLKLLAEYRRFSPERFDLVAITVDLNFADAPTDYTPIKNLCEELNVEYFIEKTDIGKIVFDIKHFHNRFNDKPKRCRNNNVFFIFLLWRIPFHDFVCIFRPKLVNNSFNVMMPWNKEKHTFFKSFLLYNFHPIKSKHNQKVRRE